MGLAERRAVKEFQDTVFPQWKQNIDAALGFDVPVDVDWTSLQIEGETHLYGECWPKVFFEPLVAALANVGRDDMGKEALKSSLKKITIKHNPDVCYGSDGYGFATWDQGTLALQHAAHTNVDSVADRTQGIVTTLEKNL
jgi:hypothetical protein